MITEKLKVEIDVDASGVKQGADEAKRSLESIKGAAGGVSGSTASMNASFIELQETMGAIKTLNLTGLITANKDAIGNFAKKINQSFDDARDAIDHFSNAGASLNPFSKLYDDVEWESFSAAIKDMKINLKEATKSGIDFTKQVGKGMLDLWRNTRLVRTAVLALAVAMGPIAGIASSFSASAMGKDIYNTAQRVGMGTAKFQEWDYIVRQTGADVSDLIGAQQTLTEAQIDVAEGAEDIIAAFEQIGLSSEEVLGMSRQELFERTIAGLQNIENATERAALGYRLLSEDASTLAALLGMSNQETAQLAANYHMLGATMSSSLIKQSLQFQGALSSLRAAFQGIANTLAEVFLPILIAVVQWVTKALAVINMFLRALFNLEMTTSTSGTNSAVGSGISGFAAMTDGIEEAEGAAKKLRRTLMGFDELNVVQNPNADAGSSGGAGGGISGGGISGGIGGFDDSMIDTDALGLDKWQDRINRFKGIIQTLVPIVMIGIGALGTILCLLGGNWAGALAFAAMAGIGFAIGGVEGGLWDTLRGKVEKLSLELPLLVITGIAAVGALALALTGNIPGAIALATVAGIGLAIGSSGDGWGGIIEKIKAEVSPLEGIIIGVLSAIALFVLGGPVLKAVRIGWGLIKTFFLTHIAPKISVKFFTNLLKGIPSTFSTVIGTIRTGVMNGWNNIAKYFTTNIAPKFTSKFWSTKFTTISAGIQAAIGAARTAVMNGWNLIKEYFNSHIGPKFTSKYWTTLLSVIGASVLTTLGAARTGLINGWGSIREYFNKNIAPKFTAKYWTTKINSVRDGAKSAFNGVIAVVEKAVNGIIKKLNTLSWKIPDWVPSYGGKKFGFNINTIKIPRLAEGGIATASTLANIGENGKEAVLPLENNTEWMDALADKIAARNQAPTKLVLKVGEKELGWASINGINQITKQTGELQLVL
jgi:hypothetical protein